MTHEEIIGKIAEKKDSLLTMIDVLNYLDDYYREPLKALDVLGNHGYGYGYHDDECYDAIRAISADCNSKLCEVERIKSCVNKAIRWITPQIKTTLLVGPKPLTDEDWDALQRANQLVRENINAMHEYHYFELKSARETLIAAGELSKPGADNPEI